MSLRIQLATAAAVAIALTAPAISAITAEDSREISSYVLTDAGLAKFTQATKKLATVPGACAGQGEDSAESPSLDEMTAKLDAVPGAQAAIQSAGMTTREYVVFMWSMLHNGMAAWAASQPGGKVPPGTLQSNMDFYKNHEAQMAALGEKDPCDEDSGEEEEPSE